MPFRRPQQLFASFALVLALAAGAGARLLQQGGGTHTPTPADTVISNHAEATYTDDTYGHPAARSTVQETNPLRHQPPD